ncbi:9268_t:CDS:2 [Scutellospora calospora]|uniref:9268_t:CDS:1 n=1 Tax=Scutellospora calospora TaxID=85575 RepID=A0ACA9K742_9GLOM|nr:9268_t:CDS:2 [Scutellospora calospora]
MASVRAATSIDWSKLTITLGLKKETIASLQAFRKRNEEAKRVVSALKQQKAEIDFDHYRNILKNKAIVNEAEKVLNSFKPTKVDLNAQIKIVETFEEKAATLSNMEHTRPFKDISVDELVKARPDLNDIVEKMVKKGRWTVPGYEEKFGY